MSPPASRTPGMQPWMAVVAAFGAVVLVWLAGSGFMPGAWYDGLAKPSFNPPSSVFGPAWGVMYLLNAIALALVLQVPGSPGRTAALWAFGAQLALNAAWTPMFFGAQSIVGALLVIVAMLVAIAFTVVRVHRIHRYAGYLLWPYLAWVAFATVLNGSIAMLNRGAQAG